MTIEQEAEKFAKTGYEKRLLSKDAVDILKCGRYDGYVAGAKRLEKKYEKLLAFALERTECCDVCPQEVCENDSGTCPYAADLKENEERVTREWLEKFIEE